MFELTILVCSHNEAHVLERSLTSLHRVMFDESISAEVVIVDDGSDDGTVDLAVKISAKMPELHMRVLERKSGHGGYGSLVRYGLAHSSGRYCALVAADGNDPVELIPKMVSELRDGNQLVICSRYTGTAGGDPTDSRYRIYQTVYRRAIRALLGQEINDSTNGFRAFDRAFMQSMGLSSTKFSVCPEMTFKTLLSGGAIAYVPGQPLLGPGEGSEKFKLRHEIFGYGLVLVRSALHRAGVRWF
jgi:glycosyltransferase involved in cell wall biosynthesis